MTRAIHLQMNGAAALSLSGVFGATRRTAPAAASATGDRRRTVQTPRRRVLERP